MDGLRTFFAYVNLRRIGFGVAEAEALAAQWKTNFQDLFRQSEAASVFASKPPAMDAVPNVLDPNSILLTAHFSAYTTQLIAIAKHLARPITVIIGNHPPAFVDMLQATCGKAGVDATAIRSGMKMLRQIDAARKEGRIIAGLFDVPWHRGSGDGRVMSEFPFGAGRVVGSDAMFDLAKRMGLRTHLSMHVERDQGPAIRFQQDVTQADCYAALQEEVMKRPAAFERLCEMHCYYVGGAHAADVVAFKVADRCFAGSSLNLKFYEFEGQLKSGLLSAEQAGKLAEFAIAEIKRSSGLEHNAFAEV
jgi:hypothetical protein